MKFGHQRLLRLRSLFLSPSPRMVDPSFALSLPLSLTLSPSFSSPTHSHSSFSFSLALPLSLLPAFAESGQKALSNDLFSFPGDAELDLESPPVGIAGLLGLLGLLGVPPWL